MKTNVRDKKTILVPTDFSDNAQKAVEYASFLAMKIGAKVLLLNAYQIPPGTSNVMINFSDILEKDSKEDLARIKGAMTSNDLFKSVEYQVHSCYGYLAEAIELTAKNYGVDLVVMGTAGASNLKNRIFGSNTVDIIKNANQPLVVVPKDVEFTDWKNITLASNEDDNVQTAVMALNELIDLHEVEIDIVSVESKEGNNVVDHSGLIKNLNGWHYTFHTERNESVVDGIVNYSNNHESDVIVLLRKSYSFVEKILHTSVTKKLALHSKKPLFLLKAWNVT